MLCFVLFYWFLVGLFLCDFSVPCLKKLYCNCIIIIDHFYIGQIHCVSVFLVLAELFYCFHEPQNSGMDY